MSSPAMSGSGSPGRPRSSGDQDDLAQDERARQGAQEEKTRLTEEEKKQNHIASEQKRRQAIREGFDRLTDLVPGLEGQGRSEGLVLQRTVQFMRAQLDERRRLLAEAERKGIPVDDSLYGPIRDQNSKPGKSSNIRPRGK